MKKMLLLGVAALGLAAASPALAAGLSLTGETGGARTPVAAALAPLEVAVAADLFTSEDLFFPLRVEMGVIEGLEIGFHYWYTNTTDNEYQWGLNAKYLIPADLVENLKIAAGLSYQSQSADGGYDVSLLKISGVASYRLDARFPLTPSLGLSYEIQGGDEDQSGVRLFGSLFAAVRPQLAVGAEFITANEDVDGDDADASFWFGARYALRENISLQAGILNNANVGGNDVSDYCLHVGGQYAFSIAK